MTTAWLSSKGSEGLGEKFLDIGGAQASSLSAKGHQKREIKLQKTPRDSAEHGEGEANAHWTGRQKKMTPTIWEWQGTVPTVEARRGEIRRADNGGRQREEGTLGW